PIVLYVGHHLTYYMITPIIKKISPIYKNDYTDYKKH
ncbi:MAG: hypothetical protein JWR09_3321, partial [Mucilaginibacter sp.]|nr:hypothetical protein [Mucilaginibacter sp.]